MGNIFTPTLRDVLAESDALSFIEYLSDHGIIGAERGFNERADVPVQAADGTDLNEYYREIAAVLELRNQQRDRFINYLTFPVTNEIDLVGVPADANFELASEYGQPVGMRGGKRFNRGYTFRFWDLAARFTWMYLAEASRSDLEQLTNMALEADNRLQFNEVMKCAFNPTNLVGEADSHIPVNVYKFYNADGEVPPTFKNTTFAGTHSHYQVNGNATLRSTDIDALEEDMVSHGYGVNNGTQLVLWASRAMTKVMRTWKVATGAQYDFIPSGAYGGGVILPVGTVIARPQGEIPNQIGTYGPWHIVEEDYIPQGYLLALASGGPDNLRNPIGIRQHKNPAYRGLRIIPGARSEYPLFDSYFQRGFGTGIRQRGAGIVLQVKASGTYDIPAAYV